MRDAAFRACLKGILHEGRSWSRNLIRKGIVCTAIELKAMR